MVEEGNRAADSTIEAWGRENKFYQKFVFIPCFFNFNIQFHELGQRSQSLKFKPGVITALTCQQRFIIHWINDS